MIGFETSATIPPTTKTASKKNSNVQGASTCVAVGIYEDPIQVLDMNVMIGYGH